METKQKTPPCLSSHPPCTFSHPPYLLSPLSLPRMSFFATSPRREISCLTYPTSCLTSLCLYLTSLYLSSHPPYILLLPSLPLVSPLPTSRLTHLCLSCSAPPTITTWLRQPSRICSARVAPRLRLCRYTLLHISFIYGYIISICLI